jgi:hypothetical protein
MQVRAVFQFQSPQLRFNTPARRTDWVGEIGDLDGFFPTVARRGGRLSTGWDAPFRYCTQPRVWIAQQRIIVHFIAVVLRRAIYKAQ